MLTIHQDTERDGASAAASHPEVNVCDDTSWVRVDFLEHSPQHEDIAPILESGVLTPQSSQEKGEERVRNEAPPAVSFSLPHGTSSGRQGDRVFRVPIENVLTGTRLFLWHTASGSAMNLVDILSLQKRDTLCDRLCESEIDHATGPFLRRTAKGWEVQARLRVGSVAEEAEEQTETRLTVRTVHACFPVPVEKSMFIRNSRFLLTPMILRNVRKFRPVSAESLRAAVKELIKTGDGTDLWMLCRVGGRFNGLLKVEDKKDYPFSYQETVHHFTVRKGSLEAVKLLLRLGARFEKRTSLNVTPLSTACVRGEALIVEALLEGGADVNEKHCHTDSLLHRVVSSPFASVSERDQVEVAKRLLRAGVKVDARTRGRTTALHLAVQNGKSDLVRCLLDWGADPNIRKKNGKTALFLASERQEGAVEMTKMLLEAGANPDIGDQFQKTVLIWAAACGKEGIVRTLLEGGADVNLGCPAGRRGSTALMSASEKGHAGVVRILLEGGADLHRVDKERNTAVSLACENSNAEILSMLLQRGANPNTVGRNGGTLLYRASQDGNLDVLKVLLKWEAGVKIPIGSGHTPLMGAAQAACGGLETAQILLAAGADVNAASVEGHTALMFALRSADADLVRMLLDAGAEVNAVDKDGWSALLNVCNSTERGDRREVVKLLLEGGAHLCVQSADVQEKKRAVDFALKRNPELLKILLKHAAMRSV
uniref:Uncharacterized protein n=1 Tax=Chromera velia CCMP2878 TaxID=1169474 RepID=A0A0G4FWA0_9ALVE|eukprot:Cvel_19090.t1-p1 / transcript=Cvel_19090.t1 / gene=Cvel_19090 / organism=Chromera_velia_CCMP2878 / gene_product=Ankyrin-2, putative / transcript_product=Ankyrin-2, putative / location=Cvel_scaffold1620:39389-41521(+) / protein_length=711 / sequence_SO=supercontig / SO=protein_coding / is_pseudo=false